MRLLLRRLLPIAVSLLFIYLAVRNLDLGEAAAALRQAHLGLVPLGVALYLSGFLFRAVRWRVMTAGFATISHYNLFRYIIVGYTANNLLPARLGEVVRAYVAGKNEGISRTACFASVMLERVFDGIAILGIFLGMLLLSPFDQPWLRTLAIVSTAAFAAGMLLMALLVFQRRAAARLISGVAALLGERSRVRIASLLDKFVSGVELLRDGRAFAASVGLSVVIWLIEGTVYLTYLRAFNIDLPYTASLLVLGVVNLSCMIPAAPGFIGIFQFASIQSLALFGISQSVALTWSVALHVNQIVPITLLGVVFIAQLGFSFGELSRVSISERDGGEPASD